MHAGRFATLTRDLAPRSRRRFFGIIGGFGAVLALASDEVAGKRKKKQHKKQHRASPPASPPPSPPSPPPGPVATADASCVATGTYTLAARVAQTFRALRSGQLTSATVFLVQNIAGADLVEIWSVDGTNAPSGRLAGVTIADVPATASSDPRRPLTATFGAPATVVQGLPYALVVNGTALGSFGLEFAMNNPCPDGHYFYASDANGSFAPNLIGDVHFETIVTA